MTQLDLAEELMEEAELVNKKIQELQNDLTYFKFQNSERANYLALQISALQTYFEALTCRTEYEMNVANGVAYTSDAGYVCACEDCENCPYDPDTCLFDADHIVSEYEDVLEDLVPVDDEDEEDWEEGCDGDCENCPYAEDEEDFDEGDEDDEDDEVKIIGISTDGQNTTIKNTPNVTKEELNKILDTLIKVLDDTDGAELIKKPETKKKKIVVKKKAEKEGK